MNFGFHPLIQSWFSNRFSEPTEPQRRGWPEIARGIHTLIAAPTGSGKTLTAFLCAIDELWKKQLDGTLIEIVDEVDCETAADLRRSLTTGTIRKSRPFVKHESVVKSR